MKITCLRLYVNYISNNWYCLPDTIVLEVDGVIVPLEAVLVVEVGCVVGVRVFELESRDLRNRGGSGQVEFAAHRANEFDGKDLVLKQKKPFVTFTIKTTIVLKQTKERF